jgi:hypothetical protein
MTKVGRKVGFGRVFQWSVTDGFGAELVCSSALIGHRRTPRIQDAGLKNGQPAGQLACMLLQSFHKRRQQIDGKREDYSRILVGTDDCQRLQVAQLNRLRLLREYLRRLEQLFGGL